MKIFLRTLWWIACPVDITWRRGFVWRFRQWWDGFYCCTACGRRWNVEYPGAVQSAKGMWCPTCDGIVFRRLAG
jgi:DNA-directed RNA polymerase subunit RPC12/RpoP